MVNNVGQTNVIGTDSDKQVQLRRAHKFKDRSVAVMAYYERYANVGTRTYSKYSAINDLPRRYQPDAQPASFALKTKEIAKSAVLVMQANPDPKVLQRYVGDTNVQFCYHPGIAKSQLTNTETLDKAPNGIKIDVAPSASSRSLIVVNDNAQTPPVMIKTHCPVRVSRFCRNLGPTTIQHSLNVSKELDRVAAKVDELSLKCFAFLPESIGVAFPHRQDEETGEKVSGWGFLVRELTARPAAPGKTYMVPFFSLYSKSSHQSKDEPLVAKLIKKSNMDPKQFMLEKIMYPVIDCFTKVFQETGVLLESHGQNTLLELDENMMPTRIVHRDCDNTVDLRVRRAKGLSVEGFHPDQIIDDNDDPHHPESSVHSLIYDSSISNLTFNYLAKTLEQHFGVKSAELQKACRARFKEQMPEFAKYFSDKQFYYADQPAEHNLFPLVPKSEKPLWRPIPENRENVSATADTAGSIRQLRSMDRILRSGKRVV